VAERPKAKVCGRSLAGSTGSNPAGSMDVCRKCCVLSGSGLCDGPINRPESPTDCGVSLCDPKTSRMKRPWPALGC
jgi:hypothetical protein